MIIEINKAKVKGVTLEITSTKKEDGKYLSEGTETYYSQPHPDLIKALDDLRIHVVLLCELASSKWIRL